MNGNPHRITGRSILRDMKKKNKFSPRGIENPIRFFYPTSDDWYPNFPRNTVEVAVHVYYNVLDYNKGMIRVVVRGADDTLMVKDTNLPVAEYENKLAEIRKWIQRLPNPLTKAWLLSDGFQYD